MKIKEKGHTQIITKGSESVAELVQKLNEQYVELKNFNLIVDVSGDNTVCTDADLRLFENLAERQMEAAKSFVVVAPDVDFNAYDEELVVVPTLLEAHDIIEMDEIQRDLGF